MHPCTLAAASPAAAIGWHRCYWKSCEFMHHKAGLMHLRQGEQKCLEVQEGIFAIPLCKRHRCVSGDSISGLAKRPDREANWYSPRLG